MVNLTQYVTCQLNESENGLRATGVPPHTMILAHMHGLASSVCKLLPAIRQCSEDTVQGVIRELEVRAIGAGTVTRDGLNESIMRCLEDAGISRILERLESHERIEISNSTSLESTDGNCDVNIGNVYFWGGKLHKFPEDFDFPNGGVLEAWQWWIAGNVAKNYRPLKELEPMDCSTRNKRKRLSDYKFLMNRLEARAKGDNFWIEDKTIEAANTMYERLSTVLNNVTKKQRMAQLTWIYAVTALRKALKSNQAAEL
jgi:hypothetical protein